MQKKTCKQIIDALNKINSDIFLFFSLLILGQFLKEKEGLSLIRTLVLSERQRFP